MAKRILMLCLALVIGIAFAMPAAAAVKSVKVGGDITIRAIYRDNLDFLNAPGNDSAGSLFLSTTRLWVGGELTDNVSVVLRLSQELDWDSALGAGLMTLDLANIKMKDLFIPGFSATLGRQELLLGKGFVVGNVNGLTGAAFAPVVDLTSEKSFDAWKLDYEVGTAPVTITLFDAKISETASVLLPLNDDIDLWGLNVGYKTDNLNIEGYALLLDEQTASVAGTYTNLLTYGARIDQNVSAIPGFNYNLEGTMQTGENAGFDKAGWAGNADASYTFQNPMQAKIGASWFYASGDCTVGAEDQFVPLYPDMLADATGRILNAYSLNFGVAGTQGTNVSAPKIYGSFKPSEKHMLSLAWFPNTVLNSVVIGTPDDLGTEIDLGYAYQYTEDVSFGLLADFATGGKAITVVGCDDAAMQVMGTVAVSF